MSQETANNKHVHFSKMYFRLVFDVTIRFEVYVHICLDNKSDVHGLRSIAPSSSLGRPKISSRNVFGTLASGDAGKSDVPLALAFSYLRSINSLAREITGWAHIDCMSMRRAGSVLIMLLIRRSSSGLPSKSICEKSS